MGLKLNLAGMTFGRLTVLGEAGRIKSGHVLWNCVCTCGNRQVSSSNDLRRGDSRSCGKHKHKHGHGHKGHGERSSTYLSWDGMIQRCTNPKHLPSYPHYGGANPPVRVAPEWTTFEGFLASLGVRPAGKTLGRILDMGNYEPGNAFWMTMQEQKLAQRNKRALLKWTKGGQDEPEYLQVAA